MPGTNADKADRATRDLNVAKTLFPDKSQGASVGKNLGADSKVTSESLKSFTAPISKVKASETLNGFVAPAPKFMKPATNESSNLFNVPQKTSEPSITFNVPTKTNESSSLFNVPVKTNAPLNTFNAKTIEPLNLFSVPQKSSEPSITFNVPTKSSESSNFFNVPAPKTSKSVDEPSHSFTTPIQPSKPSSFTAALLKVNTPAPQSNQFPNSSKAVESIPTELNDSYDPTLMTKYNFSEAPFRILAFPEEAHSDTVMAMFTFSKAAPDHQASKTRVSKIDFEEKKVEVPVTTSQSNWGASGYNWGGSTKAAGGWECDACMVKNTDSNKNCLSCETPNPKASTTAPTPFLPAVSSAPISIVPVVSTVGGFGGFGSFKQKEGWECNSCCVMNPIDTVKCCACETMKEGEVEKKEIVTFHAKTTGASGITFGSTPGGSSGFTFGTSGTGGANASIFGSSTAFGSSSGATSLSFGFKTKSSPAQVPFGQTAFGQAESKGDNEMNDNEKKEDIRTVINQPAFGFGAFQTPTKKDINSSNAFGFTFGK